MKSFLISGDRSGSGKTSITLGISAALSKTSSVQTYKVAMDYIDTSYLSGVTGRPSYNLDSYVQSPAEMLGLFSYGSRGADFGIVEGVRGLYEGGEALSDIGTTAAVAKRFGLPVVLVVNARSITRSAAAIVKGFQMFDHDVHIAGIILNNTGSERHVQKATDAIEHYCGIPVIGAVPRSADMELASRHLGLIPFREGFGSELFSSRIKTVTEHVADHVNLDALVEIAQDVTPSENEITETLSLRPRKTKRIGVAYDEAFNFYYSELTSVLESRGCEVVYFSPIHDALPDCDGYIFGGGYPELFARELSENAAMREDVHSAVNQEIPVYAECGGLMYLCSSLSIENGWHGAFGGTYHMCNVFEGKAKMPVRKVLGYVSGIADVSGRKFNLKGHEFHYSGVDLKNIIYTYT
ncbi:MAG TPA: cobyrinate a,c-diamide synthase, partial [Methanocorpusculum sp.]|nr:cobyrinate a,c-diamide synthase [Methanocorpusculum sp.]